MATRWISAASSWSSDTMHSSSGTIRISENWCKRRDDSADQDATSRNPFMAVSTSAMADVRRCKRDPNIA
eukprot:16429922-Heterocapsa_arctica.AAC.1